MAGQHQTEDKRVLSIQSHVVTGYVGNKAAPFPLQVLGFEVDPVLTVQFSNHTGYGRWGGRKSTAEELEQLFDGMEKNGLFRHSHLLTGYIPTVEALKVVERAVERLQEINKDLIYVLDPVMGDDGKFYVDEGLVPTYRELLAKATCATPNAFEAEALTGIKITSLSTLKEALSTFHSRFNIPHIVISSLSLPSSELAALHIPDSLRPPGKFMLTAGSSRDSESQWIIAYPEFDEHFEGVGDVFSALMTARTPSPSSMGTSPNGPTVNGISVKTSTSISNLASAAELAISTLQAILHRTRKEALELVGGEANKDLLLPKAGEDIEHRAARLRTVELRLVKSWEDIRSPPEPRWKAVKL